MPTELPKKKGKTDWLFALFLFAAVIATIAFWGWAFMSLWSYYKPLVWPTIKVWLKIQW